MHASTLTCTKSTVSVATSFMVWHLCDVYNNRNRHHYCHVVISMMHIISILAAQSNFSDHGTPLPGVTLLPPMVFGFTLQPSSPTHQGSHTVALVHKCYSLWVQSQVITLQKCIVEVTCVGRIDMIKVPLFCILLTKINTLVVKSTFLITLTIACYFCRPKC